MRSFARSYELTPPLFTTRTTSAVKDTPETILECLTCKIIRGRPFQFLSTACTVSVFLLLSVIWPSPALSKLIIDVENPNISRMPISIPDFVAEGASPINGRDLASILKNDLYLTGLFQIPEASSVIPSNSGPEPDFEAWSRQGFQALILGNFSVKGDELVLEARLYDVPLRKLELGKRFTGRISDHRKMVHRFGDLVLEKLTNIPGCFLTRIAFVGDSQSKEVFSMDFDGYDLKQLTRTASINLSPEWSPDGRSLLFMSYLNRNTDLWILDLSSMQIHPLSTRPGLNASARYSPDGTLIALSMSFEQTPKIYVLSTQGQIIKRLTSGRGNDISPTWSPDGSTIAYVSDQAGSPQLYIVPVNGGQPRRITFQSNYNTDPDWSPRGDLLAFSARIDGRFQICTIRTDGTDFRVLTEKGSNEDPAWSPDGRMIAFSSNRDGRKLIYIMDAHGQTQVPVGSLPGKSPAWSRAHR
ncbi:MAG: Tol-Pal system beta propeller repeat protein TolB [Desulfomonile sp.]